MNSEKFPSIGRQYRDEGDLRAMESLAAEAWALHGPRVECTPGDLDWRMFRNEAVNPERSVRLWERGDGTLVGFAWLYPNGYLDLLVHPRSLCAAVVPGMLAWAEEQIRYVSIGSDEAAPALIAWSLASDHPLVEALELCGYAKTDGCYLHTLRPLDAEVSPVPLPPGYSVRAVHPDERSAKAAVHRAAFGTERLTEAAWSRVMATPYYRPELDVVAVAPDGALAAFALGWLDPRNEVGVLEPVGTAPSHRRLGLARAVCQEAVRRMQLAGARSALVCPYEGAPDTVTLYASLGFATIDRNEGYKRS